MIEIVEADLSIPAHAEAMVKLMDEYALDPMGGGKGLSDYVKANLRAELAKRKICGSCYSCLCRCRTRRACCLLGRILYLRVQAIT